MGIFCKLSKRRALTAAWGDVAQKARVLYDFYSWLIEGIREYNYKPNKKKKETAITCNNFTKLVLLQIERETRLRVRKRRKGSCSTGDSRPGIWQRPPTVVQSLKGDLEAKALNKVGFWKSCTFKPNHLY